MNPTIQEAYIPSCHTRNGSHRSIVCSPKKCKNKYCNFRLKDHDVIPVIKRIRR